MATLCEHEFERPDSENPDYSQLEYDLYAKLQLSIRKNLRTGDFEIFSLKDGKVQYFGDLPYIVRLANDLEGAENNIIRCGIGCPLKRVNRR